MQLLPVYTGFIMQVILGVLMQTTGQPCPQAQEEYTIEFYIKDGSIVTPSRCFFTTKRVLRKMFCPNANRRCIEEHFKVLFADPSVGCTIQNTGPLDLIAICSSQSDSNQITCNGTGFQMPVDCVVRVNCSTKWIHIACNPSTTTSATSSVTSSSESTTTKATLVGGVVGGVLVGVVITVVVVVVWWKCRRRSEIKDDGKDESHVYTGLAPVGNLDHGAPTTVPDVIKMSQAGRDTSPLPDFRSENQGETSGQDTCSQGDYTYIKEVELDEDGGYSLGKGFPNTVSSKDLAKSGIDSGSGQITDTYNRLGAHAVTSTPQTDTYNRIGGERKDGKIIKDSDEMHVSPDYFVLESSPDQEDTYNRLTAGDEPRGQLNNSTYNRIGETDAEHRNGMDQELTLPDNLILEKADIPGTQDDYNRLGYVSSNLKNTYNRIGDISSEEGRSGPSPD